MSMMCYNAKLISKIPNFKDKLRNIMEVIVVPLLIHSEPLIKARANEMIKAFGHFIEDEEIKMDVAEYIFQCLLKDNN